jgi:UDP-GlcNAc:undecaprenyl-phosphate GlcNAc-1-phosphate transferase
MTREYSEYIVYFAAFLIALIISAAVTPLCRLAAVKLNIFDHPISDIKTHKKSVPYLGGLAIAAGWFTALFFVRFFTDFPSGTLRSLRGIILGTLTLLILGLIDDLKFKGLGFKSKLTIQFCAAALAIFLFDIKINFISDYWLSCIVSAIWIVGITNAFNIIDVMDGLSSGIASIACFAFLFISLPTEMIYVNFCAVSLAGALIGFIPFNLSSSKKIFMGDTGSLFIGFIMANLALGTSYTSISEIGLFAPLFILAIPIYEVGLVSFFRIRKKKLPFVGSKDHYSLRLLKMGFSKKQIILITYLSCLILALCAYLLTKLTTLHAMWICAGAALAAGLVSVKLSEVKVE